MSLLSLLILHLSLFYISSSISSAADCGGVFESLDLGDNGKNGAVCVPNACDYDMCDPGLGVCNNSYAVESSGCSFSDQQTGNYSGMASYPFGVATNYCTLSNGQGCQGGACGNHISSSLLSHYGVSGIAAVNPALFGLDQNRNKQHWGQGCTTNSGLCYTLSGPGSSVKVMITDRCAGYCNVDLTTLLCDPNGKGAADCGQCDLNYNNAALIHPNCPCIGTDGDMYKTCCGNNPECGTPLNGQCDWCAGNNHPHFDLDIGSFNRVCGSEAYKGHCTLKTVTPFKCG